MDYYKLDLIFVGLSVVSYGYDNIRLAKLITDIGNHRALVKKSQRGCSESSAASMASVLHQVVHWKCSATILLCGHPFQNPIHSHCSNTHEREENRLEA